MAEPRRYEYFRHDHYRVGRGFFGQSVTPHVDTTRVSAAEKALIDTDAERQAIVTALKPAIMARFALVANAITEFVGAGPAGPDSITYYWQTTAEDGLYGHSAPPAPLSGNGVDDSAQQTTVVNNRANFNVLQNNLLLSRATNVLNITDVALYLDTYFEETTYIAGDITAAQLVNGLSKTAPHEAAHTLGIFHSAQGATLVGGVFVPVTNSAGQMEEVVIDGVQGRTDIMFGGFVDYNNPNTLQFRPKLTVELLKMGLGDSWTRDEGKRALAYAVNQRAIGGGFDALPPNIDAHPIPLNPGGHLAVLDESGELVGDFIDLGSIIADGDGGDRATLQLRVVNYGSDPLVFGDAALAGGEGFSLSGLAPGIALNPGESKIIRLTFDPRTSGSHAAKLSLSTNDHLARTEYVLSGFARAPLADLTVTYADNNFGGLALQDIPAVVADFASVINTGSTTLEIYDIRLVENQDQFFVSALPPGFDRKHPIVLNPGESYALTLGFDAVRTGLQRGTVQILSNDADGQITQFRVVGTGLEDGAEPTAQLGSDHVAVESLDGRLLGRAVSDADGGWSLKIAKGTPIHIVTYDPSSGLVSHIYDLAGETGVVSAYQELFFEPSQSNDTDGDGVPNDIEFALGSNFDASGTAAGVVANHGAFAFGGVAAQFAVSQGLTTFTGDHVAQLPGGSEDVDDPESIAVAQRPVADGLGSDVMDEALSVQGILPLGVNEPLGPLLNGEFGNRDMASGQFGWATRGTAFIDGGTGILVEDPRITTQLAQSILLPDGAKFLQFTIVSSSFDIANGIPPDAFEVALLDAVTGEPLFAAAGLTLTDALFNLQADGQVFKAESVTTSGDFTVGGTSTPVVVTIDLTGITAAQGVTLYFDLLGFGATGSRVVVDDVRIITDGAANTAPVATDDEVVVDEDGSVSLDARSNDSDVDGDALTVQIVDGPQHGTLALNADGTLTYTPEANFFGSDALTYRVFDGQAASSLATVAIDVAPVNDPPSAANLDVAAVEDTPIAIDLAASISDIDNAASALAFEVLTAPTHGTLSTNPDRMLTYTPEANYFGGDTFSYRASDGALTSNAATVSITAAPVNDPPIADDESYVLHAGIVLDVSAAQGVLNGDTDADNDALSAIVGQSPVHGTVVLSADGGFTYTPDAGFLGDDAFTYIVGDGFGGTDEGSVTIDVTNASPVADDDRYAMLEGQTLSVAAAEGLLIGDTDHDNDVLTVAFFTDPSHGALTVADDGSFTYIPEVGFQGIDAFSYRITDGLGGEAIGNVAIDVQPAGTLRVTSFDPECNGFAVRFNDTYDPSVINLYVSASDVIVRGTTTGLIAGALIHDVDGKGFTFLKTGTALAADTYTVTLKSGATAFTSGLRGDLDGDGEGVAGGDYVVTFSELPPTAIKLGLPDFMRGPGQAVDVPAALGQGLPLTLTSAGNVREVEFEIRFNPAYLQITGANAAAGLPAGSDFTLDASEAGVARIRIEAPTPFAAGTLTILNLVANVPLDATYKAHHYIDVAAVQINGQLVECADDDAFHLVGYLGDANASEAYEPEDVQLILKVAARAATGFAAWEDVNPLMVADIDGNRFITSTDAARVNQEMSGVDRAEIPPLPDPSLRAAALEALASSPPSLSSALIASEERDTVKVLEGTPRIDLDAGGSSDVSMPTAADARWKRAFVTERFAPTNPNSMLKISLPTVPEAATRLES